MRSLRNCVWMLLVSLTAAVSCTLQDNATNDGGEKSTQGRLLEPIALNYFDFNAASDVQLLNADTTKISVSKSLAVKMGVTSFVDHPLSVWQGEDHRPIHVRATKEVVVGDRYVLDVVQTSISDFFQTGEPVVLSTEFYKDPEPAAASRRAGNGIDADLYTDDANVIHPLGVYLHHRPDDPVTQMLEVATEIIKQAQNK